MKGACSAVCLPGVRGGSYRRMTQWSDRRQWPHFPFPEVVGTLIKFRKRRQLTACMAVLCRIHSGTCMWGNSLSYFLHTPNRPLPSSKNPHFQNEAKCTNLSCENEFCLQGKKNHFHIKGWAFNLVLIQRPWGTRQWPIMCPQESFFFYFHSVSIRLPIDPSPSHPGDKKVFCEADSLLTETSIRRTPQ